MEERGNPARNQTVEGEILVERKCLARMGGEQITAEAK